MSRVIPLSAIVAAAGALAGCGDQPLPTESASRGASPPPPQVSLVALGYTDLGTFGGTLTQAAAVNELGQVAGISATTGDVSYHAFLWSHGVMQDLGTLPGGAQSGAEGVNAKGQVVGYSWTATASHAFLWDNGVMTDLGTLGGATSDAHAINDKAQVVGASLTGAGDTHAFLWQNGAMIDLGTLGGHYSSAIAINEAGQVAGQATDAAEVTHAFRWQNGVMTDLGVALYVTGMNELGHVVGESPSSHAVLWRNGTTVDLGANLEAPFVNDLGQVVAWTGGGPAGQEIPVLLQDGVPQNLGGLGDFAVPTAINDQGRVAGYSFVPSGEKHAVVWTVAIAPPIDLSPGDAANKVKLSARGQLSVAIITNPYFDATRVDPGSLALGNDDGNDTPVARDRKLAPQVTRRDVDRDGDMDVVATFDQPTMVQRGDLTASSTRLVLTGALNDGKRIRGSDLVSVSP